MHNIAVIGLRNSYRDEIEIRLDDEYIIVSYAVSIGELIDSRRINNIEIIDTDNISIEDTEQIIIAYKDAGQCSDVYEMLLKKYGDTIRDKLVIYSWFRGVKYPGNLKVFNLSKGNGEPYRAIILGMSHAEIGIDADYFDVKTFICSGGGFDLRLMEKYFYHLIEPSVERVILELPYYIFEWDKMKSSKTKLTAIECGYDLSDDFILSNYTQEEKNMYLLYRKMFHRDRNSNIYSTKRYAFQYNAINRNDISKLVDYGITHIWSGKHGENVETMRFCLKNILEECNNKGINAEIVVMPHHPLMVNSQSDSINDMKNEFYKNIKLLEKEGYGIKVHDYFGLFGEKEELFMDDCHLNKKGSYEMTMRLKKDLF